MRRIIRSRPGERGPAVAIGLDYPPSAADVPRWGRGRPSHGRVLALLRGHAGAFERTLATISEYADDLACIDRDAGDPGPTFDGTAWFGGLDACALYALVRSRRPQTYLEIGSGVSTTFAHRARVDGDLHTRIVSIDPQPRREIDALCDETIRKPFETMDLALFEALEPGDMVFFDGSHRAFMNSDVTAFLLDVLPNLPAGVIAGMHDIFLPDDYPPEWADRYYSEQYLLAAYLLGRGPSTPIVFAAHHVCTEDPLTATWRAIWSRISQHNGYGSSFWLEPWQ